MVDRKCHYPRSAVPTAESIELATDMLEIADGNYKLLGKAARKYGKTIMQGIMVDAMFCYIPLSTHNPRHQLMRLASVLTQYEINR